MRFITLFLLIVGSFSFGFSNINHPLHELPLVLSASCGSPTPLTNGVAVASTNQLQTIAGGDFVPPTIGATANVAYFSVNTATLPPGTTSITININNSVPFFTLGTHEVWIMTNCNGVSAPLPAVDMTGDCQPVATPQTYIIAVYSLPANAGTFEITVNAQSGPNTNLVPMETSGNTNNDGTICAGDLVDISVGLNTYTYDWAVPVGATNPGNSNVLNNTGVAGLYSITVTDLLGCSEIVTQTITVNTLPTVNLTVTESSGNTNNDGEVCIGDNFTLNATPGGASYSWTLNSNPIAGATTAVLIRNNVTAANDGIYQVTFEDANGCFNTDDFTININPLPAFNNTTLKVCPNAGGVQGDFMLDDAELPPGFPATNSNSGSDVDNGSGSVTVTYHTTLANAQNGVSPIGPNYTAANNTTVFARVESNITGCFEVATVTLVVNPRPTGVQIQNVNNANSPNNFTVCEGSPINLTTVVATGQTPYAYQYTLPDGSNTVGVNSNVIAADPADHGGIWEVLVTDANGCTATDQITITVTPNPSNDACSGAITVNTGTTNNLTNVCATDDLTPCTGAANDASVWYEYDIPVGVKSLVITTSSANHFVEVYEDNCTTSIAGNCNNAITLDCPEAQTIKIWVSSTAANMGLFNLTLTQTLTTAANDLCDDATQIPNSTFCQFFSVTPTTTVGACPEQFTVSGCALNYSTQAVVWYTFTTPANTGSIEFQNITANASLTVFNNSTCPVSTPLPGGSCIQTASTGPIAVSGNTTYYIAIGIDGSTGPVGFDIKYNVVLPNDDPCDGAFAATVLNGTLANQDNTCATDDQLCGGATIDKTLWYEYTLSAPNDRLTINVVGVSQPSIAIYEDGCGGTALQEECSGDGTIEFICLEPGVYYIMVGTSTANDGIFSITATPSQNAASPNDVCSNATILPILPTEICVIKTYSGNNANACPEDIAGAATPCDFNSEEVVWFEVTVPGTTGQTPTMDFEFINYTGTGTPFMGLFSGACGSLSDIELCKSGLNTVFGNMGPLNSGETYYIAVGSTGDIGGDFTFEIKFNLGPANDDPCADLSAYNISGTGSLAGSTSCAGGDPTSPACPVGDQENIVFYQFTIGQNAQGIIITINPSGTTPFSGGIVASVVENACGGATLVESECATGSLSKEFDCLPPGDYFLQVSTSSATAGDYTLTYTEIAETGPINDNCNRAIEVVPIACEWVTVTGTTVDACWENTNTLAGCDYNNDPSVWFVFTTPANASILDFRNIPAGTYVAWVDACEPTVGLCSETTVPFENITVSPNTTYYLIVSSTNPAGAPFTFDIRVIVPPANDCTPEVIASGGSPTLLNTCCATNPGDPGSCPPGNQLSTVWYEYQPDPNTKLVEVDFTPGTINGNIVVEVFQGAPGQDCQGSFNTIPGVNSFCIGAAATEFKVRCVDFAVNSIYVKVGSTEAGCGTFGLSFTEVNACDGADICAEATNFQVLMPVTDGACSSGTYCNAGSCSESGDCDPNGASTWVLIETDPQATAVVVTISGLSFTPIVTAFPGGCAGGPAQTVNCSQTTTFDVAPINNMVAIRIEAQNGLNLGNFSIEACALGLTYDCHDIALDVTRPEYPTANPTGPFCAGETVHLCFEIDFIVSPGGTSPPNGNNCQWIQGVIPTFSEGWDVVGSNLPGQGPTGSNWFPEGAVEYNGNNNIAKIITLPSGALGMSTTGGTSLMLGTELPAGWWFTSNGGGPSCTNDGDPDNMWGLPAGCGSLQQVDFCIDVKVKEYQDLVDCPNTPLDMNLFVFADGETGCWQNMSCALALPVTFVGDIDCNGNIQVQGLDKQICTDSDVMIEATTTVPGTIIELNTIDNPNVTGETLTGSFPNSIAQFTDHLVNTGTSVEIVEYVFRARGNNSVCLGPPFTLKVTVYPELDVQFDPTYVCEGSCKSISPNVTGGTGTYITYQWSNGQTGSSINVCPTVETTYFVTVTDDKGCKGSGEALVEVKPPVQGELVDAPYQVCKDGVEDPGPYFVLDITSGTDPYNITWSFTPNQVFGVLTSTNYPDDTYDIEEETSVSSTDPYAIKVNVVDAFGCTALIEGQLYIDGQPEVTFTNSPVACGQNTTVLTAVYNFGLSSSGLMKFELFDCDGNLLATKNNNTSTFNVGTGAIPNLSLNNCFVLVTTTQNGCTSSKTLTINPPSGLPAQLSGTSPICTGQNSTLSITNAAAYSSIAWSNNLTGPSITVGPNTTTIYGVTVTEANGCTNAKSFEVAVNPKPDINLVGSTSFCIGSSTMLEASSNLVGTAFTWTDANSAVTNGSAVTINAGGTVNLQAVSPGGCFRDSIINVSASTNLTVLLSNADLCDNGMATLTPGSFYNTYKWFFNNVEISGATGPTYDVSATGTYGVMVTDISGCSGSGSSVVTNSASPMATPTAPIVSVCRFDSGVGPTFLNFNNLMTGANGVWTEVINPGNSTISGVDLNSLTNVSFLNIPVDTFKFEYITNTAVAPCLNDTAFILVDVKSCLCPTINFDPIVLCNDRIQNVDLNQFLKVSNVIEKGVWTFVGGPGTLAILEDTLTNVLDKTAGIYNLSWTTSANIGNCPKTGSHSLTLNASPQADKKSDIQACNAPSPLGPVTIDLDTILQAGSDPGTWVQLSGTTTALGAGNVISTNGLALGLLTFEFTTNTAIAPCKEDKFLLNINVRDCDCPFAIIKEDTLCNGGDKIDLNKLITLIPSNTQGTWSSNASGAVSGSTFDATGVLAGGYKITFTYNPPPGGTCPLKETQDIVIRRQPVVKPKPGEGSACNVSTNGTTTVNLSNLLESSTSSGGVWTQVSGPRTLTIPASTVVDFEGSNPTDVFTFKYSVSAQSPCVAAEGIVTVRVKDCDCPDVTILPTSPICNSDLKYDLSKLETPTLAPGTWTVTTAGNQQVPVNNKSFTVDGLAAGTYKLRYTLNPAPSGSCQKFSEVTLSVTSNNVATLKTSEVVCNAVSGSKLPQLDFRNLLISQTPGTQGTWQKPANFPNSITDITKVSFNGLPEGTIYEFKYVINNQDPCPDNTYIVNIEVIDCACPPITLVDPKDECTSSNTVNLIPYGDPGYAGTWSSPNVPISAGIATIGNLATGNYKLIYTLTNPLPNCPSKDSVTLTIVKAKNPGIAAAPLSICTNSAATSVKLTDLLTNEDSGGKWTEVSSKASTGGAFSASLGTFNPIGQAAGSYKFEYKFSSQSPCPDVASIVQVDVLSPPTAQAGDAKMLSCTINEVTLGDPSDNQPGVSYAWVHDGGLPITNADKATIKVKQPGKYTITVVNLATGCTSTDDVLVSIDPNKPNAILESKNVSCFNAKDGSISFVNITGGNEPLQFSKDGGTTFQSNPTFNGLGGGKYDMVIKDATGCIFKESVTIDEPSLFNINVGNDTTITIGSSVVLTIQGQVTNPKSVNWVATTTEGTEEICAQPPTACITTSYTPKLFATVCATAIDANGCEAKDCKLISLLKARNIVFPNIINPGNTGENKFFYVESESVAVIKKMAIYDRWGNLMFRVKDVPAGDPNNGWDGTFNGKNVVPGVYTYVVEVEYDKLGSGDFETYTGDVTVIK